MKLSERVGFLEKMSAALISLLVTLVVAAYFYVKNSFSYWKRKGIPYKAPSFPFGNFSKSSLQKTSIGEELANIYNESSEPVVGLYTFLKPALLIRDPKIIKEILVKDF